MVPGVQADNTDRGQQKMMQQLAYLAATPEVAEDCIEKLGLPMFPEQLLSHFKVDQPAPTALTLSYSSSNPELAGQVANQMAKSFANLYTS
ncbi:MAG: hypothetical protein C4321_05980, partial [Chloroflexota bacterium]